MTAFLTAFLTALGVAAAGGIGAAARFAIDGLVRARLAPRFPVGTMIINLSGSLLLGLLAGLVTAGLPTEAQILAGTGFLGGYTTFSSASVETIRLIQERRAAAVIANGIGMVVLATALAFAGMIIGRSF
ncbi:putative fluoride ion transporter CrcB 2 [Microlunatus endophyticus]|uniref:Fluoride-specific ion channel FluC n=1 Tax=Microlunatus endophyticus TaxID=1716077 RepID=A0A917W4D3_9ACTN|nr:fluoride efflux transporter CrcB [Microlunatus endophyticus]GGL62191.1 putative fluoride ion transporter CrcB 2 [Microlunatus endophyticus]